MWHHYNNSNSCHHPAPFFYLNTNKACLICPSVIVKCAIGYYMEVKKLAFTSNVSSMLFIWHLSGIFSHQTSIRETCAVSCQLSVQDTYRVPKYSNILVFVSTNIKISWGLWCQIGYIWFYQPRVHNQSALMQWHIFFYFKALFLF